MELEILNRRLQRERQARLQAEAIMEKKSSELFEANERLREWNEKLEHQIKERAIQLRESERKYRGIIENMELGLMEVDNDDVIRRVYDHFCEMVGYEESELLGKRASDVFLDEKLRAFLLEQNGLRKEGQTGVYELPIRIKDGSIIWVLVSGAPIHNLEGEVTGSIGIHYDISDKKQLIEDLNKAKHMAEEAQVAEKQFLANMSHEIRTPLNAIIGMAHLLYDTQPTTEQKEYMDVLKNSANFLHSLISDILDMSKIEAGQIDLVMSEFDLAGMIRTHQKAFELRVEGRPIEVEALIDARIEGIFIGDELLINQVLNNLLGNAEKFTSAGIIGVSVKQLQKLSDDSILQFQIYDTGVGISEEDLALIFNKFKQVNLRDRHKTQGTGLGLAIAKQLIELMGGEISVQSQQNEGTTFTFILPLKRQHAPKTASPKQPTITNLKPASWHNMTILVVEDNVMNRKYLGTLLDKWEIPFDTAHNGKEAVHWANQKPYSLILMDIQMPIMDGYEATLNIRNTHNPNQHTPIVALTASATNSQKSQALEVGMNNFLSKPFTPSQLQDILALYRPDEPLISIAPRPDPTPTSIPLDHAHLLEMYGDDKPYLTEMFSMFLTDTVPEVEALTVTMGVTALKKALHKVKPTFGMVGLTDLQAEVAQLEEICQNEAENEYLSGSLDTFLQRFRQRVPFIHEYLRQQSVP